MSPCRRHFPNCTANETKHDDCYTEGRKKEEYKMKDVLNVIRTRSSIRKYSKEAIPEDICRKLIEAGLMAPTAANKQEIHISVVAGSNPVNTEIQNELKPDAPMNFYYDAPVIFYLSGSDDFKWSSVDAGIAVENMHLAAEGLGLGSVILGCMEGILNGEKKAYYDEKLQIPKGYSFRVAIAVGYPDTTKEPHAFDYEKNVSFV